MANRFLNDDGSNTADYTTEATAATTLSGLIAGTTVGAGDVIWGKSDSVCVESSSANVTIGSEGATASQPLQVRSTSDWNGDDNPTTINSGCKITTTGNYAITLQGYLDFNGIHFCPCYSGTAGSSSNTTIGNTSGPHYITGKNVTFEGKNHVAAHPIQFGNAANTGSDGTYSSFDGLTAIYGNTSATLQIRAGTHRINNMSISAAGSTPTDLFRTTGSYSQVDIEVTNSDLTGVSWTYLLNADAGGTGVLTLRNCKIPSGSSMYSSSPINPGLKIRYINVDSGNTWTRHAEYDPYLGGWEVSTSIYATTNPALFKASEEYSIKMVSSANVSRFLPLYSQWFPVWNNAAAYTPSIEVLVGADGATALDDDELWIEVDYNSGTDSPLGTRLTTLPDVLATPAAVSSGTTAWTGDGYTTERTHKLSTAQITPNKSGFIWMRVALAKASTTIYVNPPRP